MQIINKNNKEYSTEIALYNCIGDGDIILNKKINSRLNLKEKYQWLACKNLDRTREAIGIFKINDNQFQLLKIKDLNKLL